MTTPTPTAWLVWLPFGVASVRPRGQGGKYSRWPLHCGLFLGDPDFISSGVLTLLSALPHPLDTNIDKPAAARSLDAKHTLACASELAPWSRVRPASPRGHLNQPATPQSAERRRPRHERLHLVILPSSPSSPPAHTTTRARVAQRRAQQSRQPTREQSALVMPPHASPRVGRRRAA